MLTSKRSRTILGVVSLAFFALGIYQISETQIPKYPGNMTGATLALSEILFNIWVISVPVYLCAMIWGFKNKVITIMGVSITACFVIVFLLVVIFDGAGYGHSLFTLKETLIFVAFMFVPTAYITNDAMFS